MNPTNAASSSTPQQWVQEWVTMYIHRRRHQAFNFSLFTVSEMKQITQRLFQEFPTLLQDETLPRLKSQPKKADRVAYMNLLFFVDASCQQLRGNLATGLPAAVKRHRQTNATNAPPSATAGSAAAATVPTAAAPRSWSSSAGGGSTANAAAVRYPGAMPGFPPPAFMGTANAHANPAVWMQQMQQQGQFQQQQQMQMQQMGSLHFQGLQQQLQETLRNLQQQPNMTAGGMGMQQYPAAARNTATPTGTPVAIHPMHRAAASPAVGVSASTTVTPTPPAQPPGPNGSVGAFFATTPMASREADQPSTPLERMLLPQLQQIGFPDPAEILTGIRALEEQQTANNTPATTTTGAATSSSTPHNSITVETVMLRIISTREEAEEAAKEDHARLLSEQDMVEENKRRKAREKESLDQAGWKELKKRFHASWILSTSTVGASSNGSSSFGTNSAFEAILNGPQRPSLIKLLQLEQKARQWYGSKLPQGYFESIGSEAAVAAETASKASSSLSDWWANTCKLLEDAMYKLEEQKGGVPKLFLAYALPDDANNKPENDDSDIEVLDTPPPSSRKPTATTSSVENVPPLELNTTKSVKSTMKSPSKSRPIKRCSPSPGTKNARKSPAKKLKKSTGVTS